MEYQCLVVDDEKELADSTAQYFTMFGIATKAVYDGESCLQFLKTNTVDVILLDINLTDTSGFLLCQTIRKTTSVPILFISARNSDDDIIAALNIGGDDYITKPYSLSVVLAKIKVMLKRFSTKEVENIFCYKSLTVDFAANKVLVENQEITLKAMEFKLLSYLIENRGRLITKEELFEQVWKSSFVMDGTLNVHIRHLRQKIEQDPNQPTLIKTVWGRGYIFEKESS